MVTNARIYTVDSAFSMAEAFVIQDGKFLEVGSSENLMKLYAPKEVKDLQGAVVVPGLIDGHCHFYGLGQNLLRADLMETESVDDIINRLKDFRASYEAPVLLGRGWDQNDWEDKSFPDASMLDVHFPDIPVVLERVDGHAYWVNSKALELSGISAETDATGGAVVLKDGKPSGVIVDAPMRYIDAIIPREDKATAIAALKEAEEVCFSYGLTTVSDAGLNRDIIELIDSLQQSNALAMRVYAMVSNTPDNLDYYLSKGIIKTPSLHVRSVKVYGDGALGSRGAALKEPYHDDPGHFGAMITPASEIEALAERIAGTAYQMNTHAIGDSANVVVLKAYEKVLADKVDPRWRIEHSQIVDTTDFAYFSEKILPSVQPTHATSDMYWAGDRLGKDRLKGAYAFKRLLEESGILPLGTDFPVEKVSPFLTFYAAVSRQDTQGYPEGGFFPDQALSREETLRGMTIWAAYANFEENEKGSIESGKWADFTVLDTDLMEAPIEKIPNTKVLETWVGGSQVYQMP